MGHRFTVQQSLCESSMQSTSSTSSAMANAGVVGESRLFLRFLCLSADDNDFAKGLSTKVFRHDFASLEAADNETLNSKRLKPHRCVFSCSTLKF